MNVIIVTNVRIVRNVRDVLNEKDANILHRKLMSCDAGYLRFCYAAPSVLLFLSSCFFFDSHIRHRDDEGVEEG